MMYRVTFILTFLAGFVAFSCYNQKPASKKQIVKDFYLNKVSKISSKASQMEEAISGNKPTSEIQRLFRETRLAYKQTEFLAEYYGGSVGRFINGAPIPETDADDQHRTIMPEGFQVIEPFIFPHFDTNNKEALLVEVKRLKSNINRLNLLVDVNPLVDEHIFDALRLEAFRIITLGISGFDSPIAQNSIPEARAALNGIWEILQIYNGDLKEKDAALYARNQRLFEKASNYLGSNTEFNSFDRMHFIKEYANPISVAILKSWKTLGIPEMKDLRALKVNSMTLFEPDSFNPDYFAPNIEAHNSPEKTALGNLLFFDPVLSGTMRRSCASCHQPDKAFTDGVSKNLSISGNKMLKRNTPTIINAGLQASLFYDVRVSFLEDQATDVIKNPDEMHGSLDLAVKKLKVSKEYSELFKRAFPRDKEPVSEYNIRNALGSYIRSQSSFNSRFDKHIRGSSELTTEEVKGFNLYMGKAKCGTCHFAPLFNGTVPPNYTKTESEVIGVPVSAKVNAIDSDRGRFNNRRLALHNNAFRTPTVRNIALTGPYMHNGIYNTLEEVIDFYNDGGGSGLGIELENQTLPFDNLKLSNQEKREIIAFLKALTDTSGIKVPKSLPALGNKARMITTNY